MKAMLQRMAGVRPVKSKTFRIYYREFWNSNFNTKIFGKDRVAGSQNSSRQE